jgi:tRNA(Ile)-lysidine synthase
VPEWAGVFSPSALHQQLNRLALPADAAVCVAFSGGLDSSVLLHAAARLGRYRLRAVHIDHGLHSDSSSWRVNCEQQARALLV